MNKNLAKTYTASKDCCGQLVTKQEVMHIQVSGMNTMNTTKDSTTMTMINPQQQHQMTYQTGKVYRNTYVPYCLCILCPENSTHSCEF